MAKTAHTKTPKKKPHRPSWNRPRPTRPGCVRQLGNDIVAGDLHTKHLRMAEAAFPFLRATYWRWAETILDICPEFKGAPSVLGVGDLHLENFGTWRDVDGRLVWGVNDFDEAAEMPYPLDLVRLAASALLGCPHVGTAQKHRQQHAARLSARPGEPAADHARPRLCVAAQPRRRSQRRARSFLGQDGSAQALQAAAEAIREDACRRDAGGQPQDVVQPAHGRPGQPRPAALCRARAMAGRAGGARGEGRVAVGLVARQRRRRKSSTATRSPPAAIARPIPGLRSATASSCAACRRTTASSMPRPIRSSSSAGDTCARWGAKSPPSTSGTATTAPPSSAISSAAIPTGSRQPQPARPISSAVSRRNGGRNGSARRARRSSGRLTACADNTG